jgi:hypothetical protein
MPKKERLGKGVAATSAAGEMPPWGNREKKIASEMTRRTREMKRSLLKRDSVLEGKWGETIYGNYKEARWRQSNTRKIVTVPITATIFPLSS